jgi:CDP-diacylglycerol--glycerol-3-phosphate 3-phosphatidyltransferase
MANFVTLLRIFFAIPACILLFHGTPLAIVGAIVLLNYVELSDAIDGHVARLYGEVSDIGKLLDPLVDTLTRFTIFAAFMAMGIMPLWMLLIFFYRDMIVSYIRSMAAMKKVAMGARFSGKVKALFQGIAQQVVGLLLLWESFTTHPLPDPRIYFPVIVVPAILLVVILMVFKADRRLLYIIVPFGGVSGGLMALAYFVHPATGDLSTPIYWTLAAVAGITLWSLVDYCVGLYQLVRKAEAPSKVA